MLKGGLSPRQVASLRASGGTFYSKYIQAGKFLTARPWGDYVHPNQPIKMWFMVIVNFTPYFKIKAYYNDGSDQTAQSETSFDDDSLIELNCNPATHGLVLEPTGKRMEYFDVWLEHYGSAVSEVRRFQIDWNYCERPVFLMFANTFGGVDDVYLSGYIKDKFATKGNISYRPQQPTDTVYSPTLLQLDKTGQNKWTINSGWKSLTTLQYFRDLLVSKQAWYLYTSLSQSVTNIIPITDITADEILVDRKNDMYNIDLSFSEAHESKHSSDNRQIT
jgi:hypothetical protein